MAGNMLKAIIITAGSFYIMFFSSCSYYISCYNNLKGIYAADKGDFNNALTLFDKALENNEKSRFYLTYNTGTVYRDAGEYSAANDKFSSIDTGFDRNLTYRIYFELGVLAFRNNDYEKAADFFKKAVIIDNSDIKLLRNLELALLRSADQKFPDNSAQAADSEEKAGSARILDFMFSGEVPFWLNIPEKKEEAEKTEKDW